MAKVTHRLGECTISAEEKEVSSFLANKRGGFVHLPFHDSNSRFDGAFFFNGSMFKIMDSLFIKNKEPTEISHI